VTKKDIENGILEIFPKFNKLKVVYLVKFIWTSVKQYLVINCDFEKEVIFIKMNKLPFMGSNQGPHV
jgi:hypothetical protein